LAALVFNLCWLVSAAYGAYAGELARAGRQPVTARAAAGLAASLAPWDVKAQADFAWKLAVAGDLGAAREHMLQALRAAPADAFLWQDFAQLLASHWRFGEEMTLALRQASALAPNSPALLSHNAQFGILHWSQGSAAQRQIWLAGMQHVLNARRAEFLNALIVQDGATPICLMAASELGLEEWCRRYGEALEACETTAGTPSDLTACVLQKVRA
jgi:hypothetical protein